MHGPTSTVTAGIVLGIVLLVPAGCRTEISGPLESGRWGGTGVTMVVSAEGASFEFDCARGFATERPAVHGGRFSVEGRYVREHGGPVIEGEEEDVVDASFEGEVNGVKLSLWVTPLDTRQSIGPYLLRKGAQGEIRKCL